MSGGLANASSLACSQEREAARTRWEKTTVPSPLPAYRHALLLGCTGMLARAAITIAQTSGLVTSVARTRRSLETVDRGLQPSAAQHFMLALDWSDPTQYVAEIVDHIRRTVEPDLVVAWTHDDRVAVRLLANLAAAEIACDFFHVIGSSRADPMDSAAAARAQLPDAGGVRYHQVILGAVADGNARRWLTHAEISSGVIEAIGREAPLLVVGGVRQWHGRL
jgi:hypothetical protein